MLAAIRSSQPAKGTPRHSKLLNAGQRFVKNVGGQILGRITIADAPGDVAVHPGEIQLVQFGKAAGVFFRGFNQQTVVSLGEPDASPWAFSLPVV